MYTVIDQQSQCFHSTAAERATHMRMSVGLSSTSADHLEEFI